MLLAAATVARGDGLPGDGAVACWLWPGAPPSRCADSARLYVLQGHFHRDGRFEPQGPGPGRAPRPGREIVPVYRMDALSGDGVLQEVALPGVYAWRKQGWRVPGLQIDFDSPTAKLDRYARWLVAQNAAFRDVGDRVRIISVTGLGDWLTTGRAVDLRRLNDAAGVIAFMFYHRGRGIEPLETYIGALRRSSLRFKVGLLPSQRGDRRFAVLRDAPGHRGEILFHGLLPAVTPGYSRNTTGAE